MRSPEEIADRIRLAIIEEINSVNLKEPENSIPRFIEVLTDKVTEITMDEITFRRRY